MLSTGGSEIPVVKCTDRASPVRQYSEVFVRDHLRALCILFDATMNAPFSNLGWVLGGRFLEAWRNIGD